jgi:hypothetical protein
MAPMSPQMAMAPQTVQLECPNCGQVVRTQISGVVDTRQNPEMKQALMSGRFNVAVCSACGAATLIAAPLLYHDPDKQVCFVHMPQELKYSTEEQEQFIGEATNAIITTLPPDAPRGYLLTPRRFMTIQSLVDAILEADGIPREVVEQQRNIIDLISTLAEALDKDDATFQRVVEQHKSNITPEFFAALSTFIDASLQENQPESAQLLSTLRSRLIELTGFGESMSGQGPVDIEELIDQMLAASDEELQDIIADVRHVIDYTFFQTWTQRIETLEQAGQAEQAQQLTDGRKRVLELVERLDKEAQAMFEAGSNLLQAALDAPDPKAVLQERGDQIGEAFLMVLSATMESAHRNNQADLLERLSTIEKLAVEVIQERLSPEERLINELMMAETAQQRSQIMRQHATLVTTEFVKNLNALADEHEKRGLKENAAGLRQVAREAGALLF